MATTYQYKFISGYTFDNMGQASGVEVIAEVVGANIPDLVQQYSIATYTDVTAEEDLKFLLDNFGTFKNGIEYPKTGTPLNGGDSSYTTSEDVDGFDESLYGEDLTVSIPRPEDDTYQTGSNESEVVNLTGSIPLEKILNILGVPYTDLISSTFKGVLVDKTGSNNETTSSNPTDIINESLNNNIPEIPKKLSLITAKGIVVDSETNEPLKGVRVSNFLKIPKI